MLFEGLGGVIGSNVQLRRDAAGLSQDELAARLQDLGLQWSRNSVANLESRRREPTVSEFLFLSAALNVRPADLLVVPDELRVPASLSATEQEGMVSIWLAEIPVEVLPGLLYGRGYKHLTAVWETGMKATEAERVAARKFGLTVEQIQDLGFDLWGRRLDDERDERAGHPTGPGAPMKKAHVTRNLNAELAAAARKRGLLAEHNQDSAAPKEQA